MSTVKTGQFHYYSNEFDVQQLKKKKKKTKNKIKEASYIIGLKHMVFCADNSFKT
jgi:hypothetical protein